MSESWYNNGEWYITTGDSLAYDNGDTPILVWHSSDDWKNFTMCAIFPQQPDEREDGYWKVEIDTYYDNEENGNGEDYDLASFRRFPSPRVIMRDPDLGDYLEKWGITLPEIPSDLKERYLATVEDWENSNAPKVWEKDAAIRLDAKPREMGEDKYIIEYGKEKSGAGERLQVIAESSFDDDSIAWNIYFTDFDGYEATEEIMEKLGLESVRTFADDEKDFFETLKLVLPADEAKKAIRDLLVALR